MASWNGTAIGNYSICRPGRPPISNQYLNKRLGGQMSIRIDIQLDHGQRISTVRRNGHAGREAPTRNREVRQHGSLRRGVQGVDGVVERSRSPSARPLLASAIPKMNPCSRALNLPHGSWHHGGGPQLCLWRSQCRKGLPAAILRTQAFLSEGRFWPLASCGCLVGGG